MSTPELAVILKRFETPDEVREFPKGRFELVTIGGMTIGRASYEPGWRWSEDVGRVIGATHCTVEHLGMVATVQSRSLGDLHPRVVRVNH